METQIPPRPAKAAPDHSLVNLLRELRDETTTLVRQEIALAKAEMSEKVSRLGRNAGYIGAGVALAYAALILLLLGFRDLLARALVNAKLDPAVATALSSLIIAIIIGVVGWALIAKGKKALSKEGLAPKKTIESLREDQHLIKQKLART
jgi:hypothetical protein